MKYIRMGFTGLVLVVGTVLIITVFISAIISHNWDMVVQLAFWALISVALGIALSRE